VGFSVTCCTLILFLFFTGGCVQFVSQLLPQCVSPSLSPQSWCWYRCWWMALGSAGCGPAADLWTGLEEEEVEPGLRRRLELGFGLEQRWRLGWLKSE